MDKRIYIYYMYMYCIEQTLGQQKQLPTQTLTH